MNTDAPDGQNSTHHAQNWDMRNKLYGATEAITETFRDWLHGIAEDHEMRTDMDRLEGILQEMRRDSKLAGKPADP